MAEDKNMQAPPLTADEANAALEKAAKKAKLQRVDKVRACILETLEDIKGVVAGSNLEGTGFRGVGKFEDDGKTFTIMIDVVPQVISSGELRV